MSSKKLTIDNLFSERLKSFIEDKLKISQEDFSKTVKISAPYLSMIINKKRGPSADFILEIYRNYSEYAEWLFKGKVDEKKSELKDSEDNFSLHGGWTPQTKETDWGCLNRVMTIIDSDTIYSKALLQNIDAFYQAVMAGKNRRKGERRKQDGDYDGADRRKGERRQKITSAR